MQRLILIGISLAILGFVLADSSESDVGRFHSETERLFLKSIADSSLVDGYNTLFSSSGECAGCHGYDPDGISMTDSEGNDINVTDDWRATMMGMAAKDPFWRAKVSHEVLIAPGLQDELESSCTDCHAPLGFFNAMHLGMPHYTMDDLRADSVALDGVSCGACHQISPDSVGLTFSGKDIKYVEDTIYGQYPDPFAGPMQSFVGFMPVYSEHISKSELCASCHTLITETVGLDGEFNGNTFVEQATYHEWVNSSYNVEGEGAVECQSCHMTRVDENIVIAANLLFLPPRSPYSRHDWVGGNTFMLDMMKEHRDTLDVRATGAQLDSIKAATLRMLQQETLDMEVIESDRTSDTLFLEVNLTNKAGHKFPSGYPSRIAFVQMLALDDQGDTLFASGLLDEDYSIIGRDFEYEPHYDIITQEDQVQVYEIVMADESGAETTVLSQAESTLKDNRLVPFGFTDQHFAYDTTRVYGEVLSDDDFNLDEFGVQGTGKDQIGYHIPLDGYSGDVQIIAQVIYQVTPPRWLAPMFEFEAPDIDLFEWMYEGSDKEPVTVALDSLTSSLTSSLQLEMDIQDVIVYPNPTIGQTVTVLNRSGRSIDAYRLYDVSGRTIEQRELVRGNRLELKIPDDRGLYFIEVRIGQSSRVLEVLRL
jgi:hypothetical protein